MQKHFPERSDIFKASLTSLSPEILEKKNPKETNSFKAMDFFLNIEKRHSNTYMAVAYIILSSIFYTLLNLLTKINSDIPPYQLVYHRAIYEIICSFVTIDLMNGIIYTKNQQTYKLLLTRGFLGGIGLIMYFHAIYYLPISICGVLIMLTPLWIGIVSSIKEEKFDKWTFLS